MVAVLSLLVAKYLTDIHETGHNVSLNLPSISDADPPSDVIDVKNDVKVTTGDVSNTTI
ncbi:hypothetical protein DPMN_170888 [Dreissena polymorpha]|uniref:Uncharacterized protein n=1 Tax=Dreissena polymorpha TaxID=45954 RepID=A0A9D4DZF7_DREPO|nr:hypothetical protein DPMN_170888 [Dreissena polymorpha]